MTHKTVEEKLQRVMKKGIKQIAGRIEALHPQYFMDVVKMVMADIEEALTTLLQQERQTSQERERETCKKQIEWFREWTLQQTSDTFTREQILNYLKLQ